MQELQEVKRQLATVDSTTLVLHAMKDGKLTAAATMWTDKAVLLPDEVLEARVVRGRLHITVKSKVRDTNDGPVVAYDPYGDADMLVVT